MSLFDCPACGETARERSVSCPRCGHRFKHEHLIGPADPMNLLGVLVVTLAVLALVTFIVVGLV
jgi:hypothetical protein